jgi:hypothetical protein
MMPGPADYKVESFSPNKGARYSIKTRHSTVDRNQSPGPQAYKPNIDPTKMNRGFTSIGSSKREGLVSRQQKYMPGPAEYYPPASIDFKKGGVKFSKVVK